MWDYTDKVKDHFKNPRNVGLIPDADGVGEVGSLACGDALKLTFKLDKTGRIAEVKFQTFGCASAIASSSALTEIVKGMTLDEAAKVTNQDIAEFLGGLPEQKMHCSVMGREALEAAIDNYRTGKKVKHELAGRVVCTCFGVTETEIERVIRDNKLTTVEQVTNYTKAGGGCGGCKGEIEKIIARVRGTAVQPPPPAPAKKLLTNLQKIKLIEETIEKNIQPMLRQDGGSLDLIDVQANRVLVSFRGTCAQCRMAEVTMKDVVQAQLREFVSDDLIVEEVKP
ncbi:MAG: Fe-S cluster assembly protein NifU [Phycisphaerae bacterium]